VRPSDIVVRLRAANLASFGQNIAVSADDPVGQDQSFQDNLAVAYVVNLGDVPSEDVQDDGLNQLIYERFSVLVCVDNTADKLGAQAMDKIDGIRSEIFSAILAWTLPGYEEQVEYSGGGLVAVNRARLWWAFEFRIGRRISELDGVDPEDIYGPITDFLHFFAYVRRNLVAAVDFTTDEPESPDDGAMYVNMGTGDGSQTGQPVIRLRVYQWNAAVPEWVEVPWDIVINEELEGAS